MSHWFCANRARDERKRTATTWTLITLLGDEPVYMRTRRSLRPKYNRNMSLSHSSSSMIVPMARCSVEL